MLNKAMVLACGQGANKARLTLNLSQLWGYGWDYVDIWENSSGEDGLSFPNIPAKFYPLANGDSFDVEIGKSYFISYLALVDGIPIPNSYFSVFLKGYEGLEIIGGNYGHYDPNQYILIKITEPNASITLETYNSA